MYTKDVLKHFVLKISNQNTLQQMMQQNNFKLSSKTIHSKTKNPLKHSILKNLFDLFYLF